MQKITRKCNGSPATRQPPTATRHPSPVTRGNVLTLVKEAEINVWIKMVFIAIYVNIIVYL